MEAETETSDVVKSALLIIGADKRIYGGINNDIGKNYRLGTDPYPDTTEKAIELLGNYKHPRKQQHQQPRDDGGLNSFRENGGILGDADAATEGAAVGVQAEATRPLYHP